MQETLGKWAVPATWLGIISAVVGIIVHFTPDQMVVRTTGGAFLDLAAVCFLFAIAAGVLPKR